MRIVYIGVVAHYFVLCLVVPVCAMDKKQPSFVYGDFIDLDALANRYTGGVKNTLLYSLRQQPMYIDSTLERFYKLPRDIQETIKGYVGYSSLLRMRSRLGDLEKVRDVQTLYDTYEVFNFFKNGACAIIKARNDLWLKAMDRSEEELICFPSSNKVTAIASYDTTIAYGQNNGSIYLYEYDRSSYTRIDKIEGEYIAAIALSNELCACITSDGNVITDDVYYSDKRIYPYWHKNKLRAIAVLHKILFLARDDTFIFSYDIRADKPLNYLCKTSVLPTSIYADDDVVLVGQNDGTCVCYDRRYTRIPLYRLSKPTQIGPLTAVAMTQEKNIVTGARNSIVEWQKAFDYKKEFKTMTFKELSVLHAMFNDNVS